MTALALVGLAFWMMVTGIRDPNPLWLFAAALAVSLETVVWAVRGRLSAEQARQILRARGTSLSPGLRRKLERAARIKA